MKSRAALLAEIEEKRLESNKMPYDLNELSIAEPDGPHGYDPYDNTGRRKQMPDKGDITPR